MLKATIRRGQSDYDKEDPGDYSDKNDPIRGHTGEPYSEKGSSIKGKENSESDIPRISKLLYEGSPKIAARGLNPLNLIIDRRIEMRIDKYLTGLLILATLGSSLMSGSVSAKEYVTVPYRLH